MPARTAPTWTVPGTASLCGRTEEKEEGRGEDKHWVADSCRSGSRHVGSLGWDATWASAILYWDCVTARQDMVRAPTDTLGPPTTFPRKPPLHPPWRRKVALCFQQLLHGEGGWWGEFFPPVLDSLSFLWWRAGRLQVNCINIQIREHGCVLLVLSFPLSLAI